MSSGDLRNLFVGNRPVVWLVIVLHMGYAISTFLGGKLSTAALAAVSLHDTDLTALMFIGASACAVAGLYAHQVRNKSFASAWLLMPQSMLIILSALNSISLAVQGHYADGVHRSFYFIFADQLPIVLLAVLHTYVVTHPVGGDALD